MNANANTPAKWLQYLLYVGIAATVISLFGNIALFRWLRIGLNAAVMYLLYRLSDTNERYQKSVIFYAVALICGLISNSLVGLVGSVCGIIAQYQEYYGHGELVEDRDPKLAGKWHTLFWLELVVGLILGVLISMVTVILVMMLDPETAVSTALLTTGVSIVSMVLQVLYLVYLHRTVKLMENEIVM